MSQGPSLRRVPVDAVEVLRLERRAVFKLFLTIMYCSRSYHANIIDIDARGAVN